MRAELLRDVTTGAEVHLVGSLTTERGVGKASVVFRYVERDESTDRSDSVERVEVKPLVFESSPPRLDQGIGEGDFGLRQNAPQSACVDEFVDCGVEVLHAPSPRTVGGTSAGSMVCLASTRTMTVLPGSNRSEILHARIFLE